MFVIQIIVITKNGELLNTNSNNKVDNMLKTFANNFIFIKVDVSVTLDICLPSTEHVSRDS